MCLNCGCMRAHDNMGTPGINLTYEDVKRAADANEMTVDATLAMIAKTGDKDRDDHPVEYSSQMARDLSRLDDDGGPDPEHDHAEPVVSITPSDPPVKSRGSDLPGTLSLRFAGLRALLVHRSGSDFLGPILGSA